jgi:molybdopterin-guanine dinucleotide biosynthesis protein A
VTDRSAVVLAGGFSTRYGETDKTLAEIDGQPMIAHAVGALRPVVEDVVVSCREGQLSSFRDVLDGVRYRPDETPDQGPLAGLSDALGGVEGDAVAVATADMPRVPAALYRECFDRLQVGQSDAVAIVDDGHRQPVPAVFRTAPLRAAVRERRAAGDRRLRSVFEEMAVETVPAAEIRETYGKRSLVDVNTATERAEIDRE